jgi:hypothetical protein
MYLQKTKTYNIALSEIKEDLRIADEDSSYDSQLSRLIKSAVHLAEAYTGFDIVPTTNILTDYDYYGCEYFINQPHAVVNSIQVDGNPLTGFTIQYNQLGTVLKFNTSVSASNLIITYTTGSIPQPDVQRAISIKLAELFDVDVNGFTANVSATNAFERILGSHKNFIY